MTMHYITGQLPGGGEPVTLAMTEEYYQGMRRATVRTIQLHTRWPDGRLITDEEAAVGVDHYLRNTSVWEADGHHVFAARAGVCPMCRGPLGAHPSTSRVDNHTSVCSICGTIEALDAAGDAISSDEKARILATAREAQALYGSATPEEGETR